MHLHTYNRFAVVGATSLVLAACGASLWPTRKTAVSAPARDAFGCAVTQARTMGYKFTRVDSSAHTAEFRKADKVTAGPDVDEYGRADLLFVRVDRPQSDTGTNSTLIVRAGSISRRMTRRGPGEDDEYASPRAKADADSLISRCAANPAGTAPANSLPSG